MAKQLSPTDSQGGVKQAVLNLRQSIGNIVTQTTQGLSVADLKKGIAALTICNEELQITLRKSCAETLESYNGDSSLEALITDILREAVRQNPDAAAVMLRHDPASGSGSKLALAIGMAGLLQKELEGVDVRSIKTGDVAKRLFTLSKGVVNTITWMNEAVNLFLEALGKMEQHKGDQQEQTIEKGWGFGGHGIQYNGGNWSVSIGPTFGGGQIGFEIRF